MSKNLIFFVPYHTGYAHAELIHSFSSYADVHIFIYKWNPARERLEEHFSQNKQIHLHEFNIDNILSQLIKEKHRKVVVLLTASANYLFGQLQIRLFRIMQQYIPSIIDVYPVGHCMYGCQSCTYAYTHCIPITFTNYIQTKNDKLTLEKDFEILICPSYSFEDAPFSLLSNHDIIKYILTLKYSHAIKLHPLAYEYHQNDEHPFLSLTDLDKKHVEELFQSKSLLLNKQMSTLKLIEHARIIICDSNSSIPFETLYFQDKKYIFVYETSNDYDEEDDRQKYFHKFHNVEQLKDLIEKYFNHQLECKTENSHDFFLEKYHEPNGNEIEQLAQIRQWITTDEQDHTEESFDINTITQKIHEEFKPMSTPMALYALGDHTMSEVVAQLYSSDENQLFDVMQKNMVNIMALSSENDNDTVFYDANSSWTDIEATTPLQQDPRWALLSKNDSLKRPEHFCTIPLTESQLHDIARRDKLRRLRAQEDHINLINQNRTITPVTSPIEPNPILSTLTSPSIQSNEIENEQSINQDTSSAPDLLKDHIDSEHIRRQKKHSVSSTPKQTLTNSSPAVPSYQHQRSLPYPTLPVITSSRSAGDYYSKITNLSAISEPNIVELNLIDRIKKFDELSPNNRKLNDDEISRQPIVHNLDNGKYISISDANPITQTILERVHGSGSIMTLRQNSVLNNNNNNIRRNSSDNNNINGTNSLETNMPRQRHQSNEEDDDDNESTSSESSSTKSSRTIAVSLSSATTTNKSSTAAIRAASSLFHDGKRQLSRLVSRSFLRKGGKKFIHGHDHIADIDEEEEDGERLLINDGSNGDLKYKASRNFKEQPQFDKTQLLQTIVNAHNGPIWCMRFSPDGYLLATGGQDSLLKIWVLKSAQPHFNDFSRMTANPSKEQNEILTRRFNEFHQTISSEQMTSTINAKLGLNEMQAPLYSRPFCVLSGHQAPVLDVAWSKSLFILSSSMDKTVRLWHLSRLECLCFFRHVDFVSAIAFHPRDDRYFVSASLDGHVRLWNIPDKRVVYWTLIPAQASSQITAAQANLITAVNFCDDGRKVTVGTFDGRFLLYTDSLQYDTVMNIGDKDGSRSHRSRKKRRKPYKITGIESMNSNNSKVLITSNDSRIRLYDIRTKEIERKYRGYSNQSSQIRASFSHDDRYIISGSEDSCFYIWKTEPSSTIITNGNSTSNAKLTRKQRRHFDRAFERIRVHNNMVTSAIFAPNSVAIMDYLYSSNIPSLSDNLPSINRSNNPTNLPRSIPLTIPITNNNRTRLICVHAASSPIEASSSMNSNGPIYVMVTADSKGQLKLLVNRYHR